MQARPLGRGKPYARPSSRLTEFSADDRRRRDRATEIVKSDFGTATYLDCAPGTVGSDCCDRRRAGLLIETASINAAPINTAPINTAPINTAPIERGTRLVGLHELHSNWFEITRAQYDLFVLYVLTFMKTLNVVFFLFPWVAIKLYTRKVKKQSLVS